MKEFTKGVVCGVCVVAFGKIMYELGKRKDRHTAKIAEKLMEKLTEEDDEEES